MPIDIPVQWSRLKRVSAASRLAGIAVLAVASGANQAAGPSYIFQVGQLYAGVELPRVAKEYCATVQPAMSKTIASQYEAWSARNSSFLSQAREQFARANERLKAEGASLAQMDASYLQQIKSLDSGKFCRAYSDILKAKEKQFSGDLAGLLAEISKADAALSNR